MWRRRVRGCFSRSAIVVALAYLLALHGLLAAGAGTAVAGGPTPDPHALCLVESGAPLGPSAPAHHHDAERCCLLAAAGVSLAAPAMVGFTVARLSTAAVVRGDAAAPARLAAPVPEVLRFSPDRFSDQRALGT